ncbi:type II toxin-antitoxin system RelE family toxin [Crenobacter cavernae]|uniref:Type II toxin-antitoxin system RelE/ParE family toxin n=1 Tax=Crenobacter cavernae TaxID=2290923 RepID=A0A345Y3J5_9NEIS|nr:type II toxin-antitoxin system RelE/ParE family toxin [Crenobacter cavernae]AXK38497.1 type II toxin-antitoxin system RelE/ParE family toxin [Crenobacter cavernae]
MTFKLAFHPDALDEWHKLDKPVREQFKKKLAERLEEPRVPGARVSGAADLFKIKLRSAGFRLVYRVEDERVTVLVLAVGRRDRNAAYKAALGRLND